MPKLRREEIQIAEPTIGQIKTVLEDHIRTLIESFAEPRPGDYKALSEGRMEMTAAQVRDPQILHEIACIQRALELLPETQLTVPRGTISRDRLELIKRITQRKEFSPETADALLAELIAHADQTIPTQSSALSLQH